MSQALNMLLILGLGVFTFGMTVAFIGYKMGYMSK